MCPPAGFEGIARSEPSTGERPEAVRIWLLGGFKVSVGSRTIDRGAWRLRKAAALIKLLALASGHRLHREQAMDLLWPNLDSKAAANNLHHALHVARRALGPATDTASGHLAFREEQLALCPSSPLWLDVEAFEEAAAAARRVSDPAAYRAALDLYAEDLLPEDLYEEWTEPRRAELRRLYLALLVEMAAKHEERKEFDAGVEALSRVLAEEPASEQAHVGLMASVCRQRPAGVGAGAVQAARGGSLKGVRRRARGGEPSPLRGDLGRPPPGRGAATRRISFRRGIRLPPA